MPLTNGDVAEMSGPAKGILDHNSALDVLKKEYPRGDGLDAHALLDSAKNGALTYNDFLVLPGYIGKRRILCMLLAYVARICCF